MKRSPADILAQAESLARRAATKFAYRVALTGEAEREHRHAATWHLRRAAVPGSRDNLVHAMGSGEECLGGLDIDPVAMLGFKASGAIGYRWLIEAAQLQPDGTFVDHVRIALCQEARHDWCAELGAYHRFQWKREVYAREVTAWRSRPEARDPASPWRRRNGTVKQRYLLFLIVNCLAAAGRAVSPPPAAAKRGELHDWLDLHGGQPLFWRPPPPPPTWSGDME